MVRENNGAGATGFVVTIQVGHRMDRNIFEKNGNDGNIFVVAFKNFVWGVLGIAKRATSTKPSVQ